MDARTVAARLRAEGIGCAVHKAGTPEETLTASVLKLREDAWPWACWIRGRVKQFPGACVRAFGVRDTKDRAFGRATVIFRLGPAPETEVVGRVEQGRAA